MHLHTALHCINQLSFSIQFSETKVRFLLSLSPTSTFLLPDLRFESLTHTFIIIDNNNTICDENIESYNFVVSTSACFTQVYVDTINSVYINTRSHSPRSKTVQLPCVNILASDDMSGPEQTETEKAREEGYVEGWRTWFPFWRL